MARKASGEDTRPSKRADSTGARRDGAAELPPKEQSDERTAEIAEAQAEQPKRPEAREPQKPAHRTAKRKAEVQSPIEPAAGPEVELEEAPADTDLGSPEEQQRRKVAEGRGSLFPVVGIGASAGGLEAMRDLLAALPTDTGMAFVIVPHLAREHESVLVDIIGRATEMPVTTATTGHRIEPDNVYVIPPNYSLALYHGTLNLMPPETATGARTIIDSFLRSLAEDQGSSGIAVILSGTGSDGALGARAVKAQDGIVFAQSPETAAYDGMPRSAIDTGSVDFVMSPADIARELQEISRHPYVRRAGRRDLDESMSKQAEQDIQEQIFIMLREQKGVDFAYYKPTTVKRRIDRRMVVHRLNRLDEYLGYMRAHLEEVDALYQDLLISVTGFFREPEAYDALKTEVFPKLLEGRGQFETLRIWVPACSTGEEAYSLAIAMTEFLDTSKAKPALQIFATDISDTSIEKARTGIYPENIAGDMSAERLDRFFVRVPGGYQVGKGIREAVVFAKHDVTKDPPFSRLDLISCRNLLIYLGAIVQKRLIPIFHYALQPAGFLLLGSSESVGEHTDLFGLVNSKYKIYQKKPVPGRPPIEFGFRQYPLTALSEPHKRTARDTSSNILWAQNEADRIAGERFVPPGVLVNEAHEIVQFKGDTSPFLRHSAGKASLDVLEMARDGLAAPIAELIARTKKERKTVTSGPVQVRSGKHLQDVDIEVSLLTSGDQGKYYLIFFREPVHEPAPPSEPVKGKRPAKAEVQVEAERLRRELAHARDQLKVTIAEKDSSYEELRAANEEIQSSNEELQSINEELETAKEELQSTNEELTTLNEELQNRNAELLSVNDDLRNVLSSVNIPIIMVGRDTRIRRYTPMAEKALNLIPSDIGRPIGDLKMKMDVPDLDEMLSSVTKDLSVLERQVKDDEGHWYLLQLRPYRTMDDRIDGVVISMLDIDEMKRLALKATSQ